MTARDIAVLVGACVVSALAGVGAGFLIHTLWTALT